MPGIVAWERAVVHEILNHKYTHKYKNKYHTNAYNTNKCDKCHLCFSPEHKMQEISIGPGLYGTKSVHALRIQRDEVLKNTAPTSAHFGARGEWRRCSAVSET